MEGYTVHLREDGWYVIGNNTFQSVESEEDGYQLIEWLTQDIANGNKNFSDEIVDIISTAPGHTKSAGSDESDSAG
jgi:hypothetical protein